MIEVAQESEHYARIKIEWKQDRLMPEHILGLMEEMYGEGFRPLHFDVGSKTFICEKNGKTKSSR